MVQAVKTLRPRGADVGTTVSIKKAATKQRDERRGTAASRGYDAWWQRWSTAFRRENPLCVCCEANGFVSPAELVDHVIPHKGCKKLFRDALNWQSLCWDCHGRIKAVLEQRWARGEIDDDLLKLDRVLPEFFPVC